MTSLQERLFAMQDKQYAAFQAKLTPGEFPLMCIFLLVVVISKKSFPFGDFIC